MVTFLTYIGVGYGTVAPLHDTKLSPISSLEAIVDPQESARKKAANSGIKSFTSIEEYAKQNSFPDFWDIRVPTDNHFSVIKQIIALQPPANLIVEKPACLPEETEEFRQFLSTFKGRICVNENYLCSDVTQLIKELIKDSFAKIETIELEMTKNRSADFLAGRYVEERGAFMYEGSHMLAILQQLQESFLPNAHELKSSVTAHFSDAEIGDKIWPKQGSAEINYKSKEGVRITLYTSMMGKIKFPYFIDTLIKNQTVQPDLCVMEDTKKRHRVIAIHGLSKEDPNQPISLYGFYDPIQDYAQYKIKVIQKIGNKLKTYDTQTEQDDTMGNNLRSIIDFFQGKRTENPSSAEEAVKIVEVMDVLTSIPNS